MTDIQELSETLCVCGHERIYHTIYTHLSDDCDAVRHDGCGRCPCKKFASELLRRRSIERETKYRELILNHPCNKCRASSSPTVTFHRKAKWYNIFGCSASRGEHLHFTCDICSAEWIISTPTPGNTEEYLSPTYLNPAYPND